MNRTEEVPLWLSVFPVVALTWVAFTVLLAVRNRKRLREKDLDATFADVGVAVLCDPMFERTRKVAKIIFSTFSILLVLVFAAACIAFASEWWTTNSDGNGVDSRSVDPEYSQ